MTFAAGVRIRRQRARSELYNINEISRCAATLGRPICKIDQREERAAVRRFIHLYIYIYRSMYKAKKIDVDGSRYIIDTESLCTV